MKPISLIIHGGAGAISKDVMPNGLDIEYEKGLTEALNKGYQVLENGGKAIDAVVDAIKILEDNPLFNAGKGAVFTKKGLNELDAAIMDGKDLNFGSVCGVRNIKNPIDLARAVLEKSDHVMLSGNGARDFALDNGIELASDQYFFTNHRYDQWIEIRDSNFYQLDHKADNLKGGSKDPNPDYKFGTVGAVALDQEGNIVAGTSTGGMTNKKYGRIGDSPIIGAGTYANNNTCGISCTGHGELFMRLVVSHEVSALMEYKGLNLQDACDILVKDKLVKIGGEGGLIALDKDGNHAFSFNSLGMYRAIKKNNGEFEVKMYG